MTSSRLPLHIARQIKFRQHPTMTACWLFTGHVYDQARGPRLSKNGVTTTARQVVYRYLRGTEPGMLRCMCGERLCVNPNHMKERSDG